MRGGRLLDAVELDDDDALQDPGLVCLSRGAASQKSPAGGCDRRPGKLGISGQRFWIRNRTIRRYPIGLCHCSLRLQQDP